jgi:hypothetical protein
MRHGSSRASCSKNWKHGSHGRIIDYVTRKDIRTEGGPKLRRGEEPGA